MIMTIISAWQMGFLIVWEIWILKFNSAIKMLKLCLSVRIRAYFSAVPKCMVLHPVGFPNKGPVIEQYLAEEAVGLVSSLNWDIVRGPFWKKETSQFDHPNHMKKLPHGMMYMEPKYGGELKDGTYVRSSLGDGMYYKDGIIFDGDETESDGDLHQEWQNRELRESLANSSLVKCKKITQKYFFTKGKLERIISHVIKTEPTCIFINSQLKPGQIRNLKKILESQLNNKSLPKAFMYGSGQQNESQTQLESTQQKQLQDEKNSPRRKKEQEKRIQIFDRFSIILQIFSKRTTSKLAKLQIQLSYLSYLKTRLVRDGSTYSSNLNLFSGDLLNNQEINMEIISAKQRRAIGMMSGEGESQLEIQRRNIKNKEAKIRKQIEVETKLRENKKEKQKNKNVSLPIIALVGYTNVGKSAFMNYVMGKQEVQSKDLLFQTLKTTSRYIELPSGTKAILMDTIGFISDLPIQMIDSFKATLEDISHADLVIHLRDMSHPQNQLQRESVIRILRELRFEENFYSTKMINVWNKVDLVESSLGLPGLQQTKNNEDEFKISCKTGKNMSKLLTHIDQKLKQIRGLGTKQLTYSFDKHHLVIQWLRKNANISYNLNETHNYEMSKQFPKGSVRIELELDEINYNKLVRFILEISNKQYKKDKSRKGLPPKEGW